VRDYGGVIWDGEPFIAMGRAGRVKDLEALPMIFLVNERAIRTRRDRGDAPRGPW
jgi:hypothetical protein